MSDPLRVGILGVAGISSKTAIAISHPETDCEVRAVASRSLEKAEVGSYDALDFLQSHIPFLTIQPTNQPISCYRNSSMSSSWKDPVWKLLVVTML
jgi:hypothetical protein